MASLLDSIQEGWRWAIGTPVRVLAVNSFGNVIVQNSKGQFFRIIPENLEYVFLCDSEDTLEKITRESQFAFDWDMKLLREQAERTFGNLTTNECYHLVIPATLGGAYDLSNIKKISIGEWLSFSGCVAQQIKDLPDRTSNSNGFSRPSHSKDSRLPCAKDYCTRNLKNSIAVLSRLFVRFTCVSLPNGPIISVSIQFVRAVEFCRTYVAPD